MSIDKQIDHSTSNDVTPVELMTTHNEAESKNHKTARRINKKKTALIGGSALALLGTSVALVAGITRGPQDTHKQNIDNTPTPDDKQTSSVESTPVPTEKVTGPESPIYSAQDLEIPTTLTAEQAAQAYVDDLNKWATAGMTENNASRAVDAELAQGYNSRGYADAISKQYAEIFTKAVYAEGASTSELTSTVLKNNEKLNSDDIILYLATSSEAHPFERTITADKITVLGETDASVQVLINISEHNNSNQNRVGSDIAPEYLGYDGLKSTIDVTMTKQNGAYRVVSDLRK